MFDFSFDLFYVMLCGFSGSPRGGVVTKQALRTNIDWKSAISLQRGLVDQKLQVEGVAPPTILLLGKLG